MTKLRTKTRIQLLILAAIIGVISFPVGLLQAQILPPLTYENMKVPDDPSLFQIWISPTGGAMPQDGRTPETAGKASNAAELHDIIWNLHKNPSRDAAGFLIGSNLALEGVQINFMAGTYETQGFSINNKWRVVGAGMNSTILRHVPGTIFVPGGTRPYPDTIDSHSVSVIRAVGHVTDDNWVQGIHQTPTYDVVIRDLTIDCNGTAVKNGHGYPRKANAIDLRVGSGEVTRVKVIGYGAWSLSASSQPLVTPLEVFPISLNTNHGAGFTNTRYLIYDCVAQGNVTNAGYGGYCTAFMISQPNDPLGRALIENNQAIRIRNGIATGGAFLEGSHVEYRDNSIVDCWDGFNFDTGTCRNVRIIDNDIDYLNAGINLGSNSCPSDCPVFEDYVIMGNLFTVPVGVTANHPAVRIRNRTESVVVVNNTFDLGYMNDAIAVRFEDGVGGNACEISNSISNGCGETGSSPFPCFPAKIATTFSKSHRILPNLFLSQGYRLVIDNSFTRPSGVQNCDLISARVRLSTADVFVTETVLPGGTRYY